MLLVLVVAPVILVSHAGISQKVSHLKLECYGNRQQYEWKNIFKALIAKKLLYRFVKRSIFT